MSARLLAQLAHVFACDAEHLAVRERNEADAAEADRLFTIADSLFIKAEGLGFCGGADAAFGAS